jgi:hypothetical protein
VAAAALLVIALRPTVPGTAAAPGVALLVTAGASEQALRRAIDSRRPARTFRTPDAVVPSGPEPVETVRSLAQIRGAHPSITSVVILGWGLEADELDAPIAVEMLPGSPVLPDGVTLTYPPAPPYGAPVRLAGRVHGATGAEWIRLDDLAGPADSTPLSGDGAFSLHYLPPASGPTTVTLSVDGEAIGAVALQVSDPIPGRVLILEAAPTFEGTALRRWMAAAGAAVVHRTRISREAYRTEYLNTAEVPVGRLTPLLLGTVDLVVADDRTLANLTRGEHDALRQAVTEGGTGVVVLAGEAVRAPGIDGDFFLTGNVASVAGLEERSVRPVWTDGVGPPVPLPANPAIIEERFGQEILVEDGTGQTLVQVASRGAGRVALMIRVDWTRWLRHDEAGSYARLWSAILSQVMRNDAAGWSTRTAFPTVDRPLAIVGRSGDNPDHVTVATAAGLVDTVYLAANDDGFQRGHYWPRSAGWHRIDDGTAARDQLFYVYAPNTWPAITARRRLDASAVAAVSRPAPGGAATVTPSRRPMPLGWAYGVFLLAMALLWLAEDRVPVIQGRVEG